MVTAMSTRYVYVSIDTYRCNGCGSCAVVCPELFHMDEGQEKAELIDGCVAVSPALEQAVTMCPVECIELEEC